MGDWNGDKRPDIAYVSDEEKLILRTQGAKPGDWTQKKEFVLDSTADDTEVLATAANLKFLEKRAAKLLAEVRDTARGVQTALSLGVAKATEIVERAAAQRETERDRQREIERAARSARISTSRMQSASSGASAGLATQFTVQAFINIAVNVGLAPSKGMTLPFISYGGSSLITVCVMAALILRVDYENRFMQAGHPGIGGRAGAPDALARRAGGSGTASRAESGNKLFAFFRRRGGRS